MTAAAKRWRGRGWSAATRAGLSTSGSGHMRHLHIRGLRLCCGEVVLDDPIIFLKHVRAVCDHAQQCVHFPRKWHSVVFSKLALSPTCYCMSAFPSHLRSIPSIILLEFDAILHGFFMYFPLLFFNPYAHPCRFAFIMLFSVKNFLTSGSLQYWHGVGHSIHIVPPTFSTSFANLLNVQKSLRNRVLWPLNLRSAFWSPLR